MSDKLARSMDTNEIHNETALKEVKQLIKDGIVNLTPDIVNRLRVKYSDDSVVDAIMEFFADRRKKISKVAKVFMDAFEKKYRDDFYTISLSKFMKRALKYKNKYKLSDDQFDEVKRIFETRIFNSSGSLATRAVVYPNTSLSRVLGYPITESNDAIIPTNPDDYAYLQDILKLYQMFRSVHSYVVIQTMTYQDLSTEATTGKFQLNYHDVNRFVHPVLAAFFLPKINVLEERMLYANIAGVINSRFNKERIITKPDAELLDALIKDPNDSVCDINTPMKDIKSRVEVQAQLWNNVYNLRNGKYYEANSMDFLTYIDKCKISSYDNPDILYLSDEGVILRRLFSIFSFRPIIIQTQPIFGVIINNPLNLPVNNNVITSIPYITYKLPQTPIAGAVYQLSQATNMIQPYMENGIMVPKATQILYARGVIVFHVPRKSASLPVNYANPITTTLNISQLSLSPVNYQSINRIPMQYDDVLPITDATNNKKDYLLRSVVAIETLNNTSVVVGQETYLFKYSQFGQTVSDIFLYKPRTGNLAANMGTAIFDNVNGIQAKDAIQEFGTIFVYVNNDS